MSWTAPKPFPHYIVLDLGAPHKALQFRYVCRNGGGRDNPKAIDVLVSDAFTESAATYANETGTRKLASFTNLPNTLHATYETNRTIKSETPFPMYGSRLMVLPATNSGWPWPNGRCSKCAKR